MNLFAKPDFSERFFCAFSALCPGNAGNRQRKLHVCQNGLMWNQIVALKNESDGVIAVGIPIPILILFCGNAVDNQIAGIIAI